MTDRLKITDSIKPAQKLRTKRNILVPAILIASISAGLVLSILISPDKILSENNGDANYVNSQLTNEVSPIGAELNNNSTQYRFGEYRNSIIYGPYILEDKKYYYHEDRVLNDRLEKVSRDEVKSLHNFYLKTYLDPLFYSPGSGKMNISGFERFEEQKVLSERCGMDYDLIPGRYFEELENNYQETENFYNYASHENAEKLISQNINTTESYSEYVGNFIDLVNRDVSDNRCFSEDTENIGIAKATRTPTQYRIDSEVLLNYSNLANENAQKLIETIQRRKSILNSETELEINSTQISIKNYSYINDSTFGPEEAKERMNQRRISEVTELGNEGYEAAEEETETHSHGEESNHSHGEETHTHEEDEKAKLTLEQWREVRLVNDKPVKYNLKTSCMERDNISVYGWDKNIYPNIMMSEELFFENQAGYLKDFFTLSRCPYVEITRLKWYLTDDLYHEIEESPIRDNYSGIHKNEIKQSEEIFLRAPGEESLSQLSSTHEAALKENLKLDTYDNNIPLLWRRSLQEKSKLHEFKSVYDDFYNDEHMEVWTDYFPETGPDAEASVYNNFLLLESVYSLTFMTWSDSVWRLNEKPDKFAGKLG